ncbi:hypothetical protein jhhlp_008478 [Lomentospora prolificans]|uniref:Uncharacterized protein n=1 Tax=Lomentospora prolificans TaxID=41688 RepID=A0A2N3MY55_9PEZI|nr:hypothetical protein jhhlp_008478 [Lomentospora prolificans]
MPFDFKAYDAKCNGMTPEELQREWQHYTRLISGASTSTAVSGLALPLTCGVSVIGVGMAAPAIHNARKKREIIEKHLNKHGTTHHTRKRDVLGSVAFSGTIGVVTLGVGSMGADAIAANGAEHGISAIVENEMAIKIVTHAALDGAAMGIEHMHTSHTKKAEAHKAFQAAGVFQAVANAKAQEAGYGGQPNQQYSYGPGSSNAPYQPYSYGPASSNQPYAYGQACTSQPQAHPTYADQTWVQPPPSYDASIHPPPAGFVPDSKAPVASQQGTQSYQYTAGAVAQQNVTYQYGPAQPAYQQSQSSAASYNTLASAIPQTSNAPASVPGQAQQPLYPTYGPAQSAPQVASYNAVPASREIAQSTQSPPYNSNPTTDTSVSTYDMKAMANALPPTDHSQAQTVDRATTGPQESQQLQPDQNTISASQPAAPGSRTREVTNTEPEYQQYGDAAQPAAVPVSQEATPAVADAKLAMSSTITFESFDYYELPAEPVHPQASQSASQPAEPQVNESSKSAQPQEPAATQQSQPPTGAAPAVSQDSAPPQPAYGQNTASIVQQETGSSSYSTSTASAATSYDTASYASTECPTPMTSYSYVGTPSASTVSVCSTPYQAYQTYNPQDYASTPTNNMPPPSAAPSVPLASGSASGYNAVPAQYHYGPAAAASSGNSTSATYQTYQPAQAQSQSGPVQSQATYQPQAVYHTQPVNQASQQATYQTPQQPGQPYQYHPTQQYQYQPSTPSNQAPQSYQYGPTQPSVTQAYVQPTAWNGTPSYT